MKRVIYSAWPYANGDLHLGRIGGSFLPADILFRYYKELCDCKDTYFISGSDMHGTPIMQYAKLNNLQYSSAAFFWHNSFIKTLQKLDINLTTYASTHTPSHYQFVSVTLQALFRNKVVVKELGVNLFCKTCNKIIAERFVCGNCKFCNNKVSKDYCNVCEVYLESFEVINPICKNCNTALESVSRETYKLDLSVYKSDTLTFAKKTLSAQNFKQVFNFFKNKDLKRDIMRDIEWGIPSPFNKDLVVYVWFDAICAYLSYTPLDLEAYESYYFMGIDNLIFHSVILPAIHLALNKPLPTKLFIRKYFLTADKKMSSSEKNYLTFEDLQSKLNTKYASDFVRFYFCSIDTLRKESNIFLPQFCKQINTVFINLINNFFVRFFKLSDTLKFRYFLHENYEDFEGKILINFYKNKNIENAFLNFENFLENEKCKKIIKSKENNNIIKNNNNNNNLIIKLNNKHYLFLKEFCELIEDSDLVKSLQVLVMHFKNLNSQFQEAECWKFKPSNFEVMNEFFDKTVLLLHCLKLITPKLASAWLDVCGIFINAITLKSTVNLIYLKHLEYSKFE